MKNNDIKIGDKITLIKDLDEGPQYKRGDEGRIIEIIEHIRGELEYTIEITSRNLTENKIGIRDVIFDEFISLDKFIESYPFNRLKMVDGDKI